MKNVDNRVKCIKIYTNGKSAEIQKKLFELGAKWNSGSPEVLHLDSPFLYVDKDGVLMYGSSMIDFKEYEHKEVDCLDVLSWEVKPEVQLKPFQKVLVRDFDNEKWKANFFSFSFIDDQGEIVYGCVSSTWNQCIPYRGNEHLLGTKNSPDNQTGN